MNRYSDFNFLINESRVQILMNNDTIFEFSDNEINGGSIGFYLYNIQHVLSLVNKIYLFKVNIKNLKIEEIKSKIKSDLFTKEMNSLETEILKIKRISKNCQEKGLSNDQCFGTNRGKCHHDACQHCCYLALFGHSMCLKKCSYLLNTG